MKELIIQFEQIDHSMFLTFFCLYMVKSETNMQLIFNIKHVHFLDFLYHYSNQVFPLNLLPHFPVVLALCTVDYVFFVCLFCVVHTVRHPKYVFSRITNSKASSSTLFSFWVNLSNDFISINIRVFLHVV